MHIKITGNQLKHFNISSTFLTATLVVVNISDTMIPMAAEVREPDQLSYTVNKLTRFVRLAFARPLFWTPT